MSFVIFVVVICLEHYIDVIMTTVGSQITSLTIVYLTVYSGADQRKHQSSASLAFVRLIHRVPVNSPHKWPVTRKMFQFDDVIMGLHIRTYFSEFNQDIIIICAMEIKEWYKVMLLMVHSAKYSARSLWVWEMLLMFVYYMFVTPTPHPPVKLFLHSCRFMRNNDIHQYYFHPLIESTCMDNDLCVFSPDKLVLVLVSGVTLLKSCPHRYPYN